MKEKTSIFDEENIIIKQEEKKIIYIQESFWSNFWKYMLAFLIALLFFILIWYLFLKDNQKTIITNEIKTYSWEIIEKNNNIISSNGNLEKSNTNNNNDFIQNQDLIKELKNKNNSGSLENFSNLLNKEKNDNPKKDPNCNLHWYNNLKDKIEELQELAKLKENIENFINTTDKNNLEKNFKEFEEKNNFLENQAVKNNKTKDSKINDVYNEVSALFWRDSTYVSSDKSLWIEVNDLDMSVVIPLNSNYPIRKKATYLTRNAYQKIMKFKVYHWNNEIASKNKYLWEFIIPYLKPIKEVWPRVSVIFDVEKDWKINFLAQDIKYPNNIINWFLDSEVDILKKRNNNTTEIKKDFEQILKKVDILVKGE